MPEELPQSVRKSVVEHHLLGMSRQEIQRVIRRDFNRKVGAGSVSNIERDFEDEVENSGIEAAAREFGVSGLVKELQEVGGFAKRNSVDLAVMVEGGKLAVALRENKVPVSDVSRYVLPVYTRMKKVGYDPDAVAGGVEQLERLEEEYGPFEDLKSDYEGTAKKLSDANGELLLLQGKVTTTRKDLGKLEKEYGVSSAEAKAYADTRLRLESVGMDMDDVSSADKCLSNLKQLDYSPAKAVNTLKKFERLDNEIASLEGKSASLTEDVGTKGRELERVRTELKKRTDELDEAKHLAQAGLDIETIREIRETVEFISRRRKIPPSAAMKQFRNDVIRNYDPVLGLRVDIAKVKVELGAEQGKLGDAEKKRENQEKLYLARKSQIEAFQRLLDKGIDSDVLLGWDETIAKSGLDVKAVSGELRTYKSLKPSLDSLKREMQETETRTKKLSVEAKALEERKSQLEASIDEVTRQGLRSLESHLEEFQKSLAEIRKETLNGVRETSEDVKGNVGALEKSVAETVKEVDEKLGEMQTKISGIVEKALQTGQETQKIRALGPLVEFYEKGEGSRTDVLMLSMRWATNLERWAAGNGLGKIESSAASLGEAIHGGYKGP